MCYLRKNSFKTDYLNLNFNPSSYQTDGKIQIQNELKNNNISNIITNYYTKKYVSRKV